MAQEPAEDVSHDEQVCAFSRFMLLAAVAFIYLSSPSSGPFRQLLWSNPGNLIALVSVVWVVGPTDAAVRLNRPRLAAPC
jgi:hypothetical protein